MGFFKKRDKVIDLRGNYRVPEKSPDIVPENKDSVSEISAFGFGNFSSSDNSSESSYVNLSENNEERKTKLTKRLLDMTNKIEDLSNQIYHLTQRMEILEKRLKISYN
jgi:hypothetical protein